MSPKPWLPLILLVAGCAPAAPEPTPVEVATVPAPRRFATGEKIAYGANPQQVLELFPGKPKSPLVVFVHGGAWQSGSRSQYAEIALILQRQGIAAATVDYRLSPAVQHPAHADDVAHALAWLVQNAAKHGFDPKRIFIVGHSAGGHIAATIATDPKLLALASPAGFVGIEGIYDIPNLAKRWPTYPDWFLKKAFGPETGWPAASPTRLKVASKSPWLLIQSKGDELVDAPQTENFAKHLTEAGVKVETLFPEGFSHDAIIQNLSDPKSEVAKAIIAFVEKK